MEASPRVRADALVRTTLSLGDATLRARYVATTAREGVGATFALALDVVCERAEQAEASAREALIAIVDALNEEGADDIVLGLREEVARSSLLSLGRLIRHPPPNPCGVEEDGRRRALSHDGRGRPLTLGERKSLARRPDRATMQKLLGDPHPDVIRRCLRNPRMTEDDVVRLAARRPGRGEVLAEIARSIWVHRPRVRLALVLNPSSRIEMAERIVGLLLRPELDQVAHSPAAPAGVRALCLEHLERRPPVEARDDDGGARH